MFDDKSLAIRNKIQNKKGKVGRSHQVVMIYQIGFMIFVADEDKSDPSNKKGQFAKVKFPFESIFFK